jgi:single-stranded DNA-binding protein
VNISCFTAKLAETPKEVYVSANSTKICCKVILPPAMQGKEQTHFEYSSYGRDSERFRNLAKDTIVYIHRAKLRFDVQAREFSLHGGTAAVVTESFPIFNTVVLAGRCVKDINQDDVRAFKTTADGLMICNQTLSVSTGRQQADLFNFYAINKADDRLNLAELLVNFTRKGTGVTIEGALVTDGWNDKETKERRTLTKIKLNTMTLAPKQTENQQSRPTASQQVVSGHQEAPEQSAGDVWGSAPRYLPELPGQYSEPALDEDIPF